MTIGYRPMGSAAKSNKFDTYSLVSKTELKAETQGQRREGVSCPRLSCHPTFYVPPPLFQVFLEAESVLVAESEVFALVFAAAEPALEVVASVAELEVVFALVFAAAEPALEVVASVAELEVVFALVFAAAEPALEVVASVAELEVVFVSVADVAEPRASVDIAVAVAVSVPVSVFEVEIDSSGRPKFLAFPNVDHFANSSSSVEVVG